VWEVKPGPVRKRLPRLEEHGMKQTRPNRCGRTGLRLFACFFLFWLVVGTAIGATLLDDRVIHVRSRSDVREKRRELIAYLWGSEGFPERRMPERVQKDVTPPVRFLSGLARVDEIWIRLAPGLEGLAYHFIPAAPNGHLVVVHHGHGCTMDDNPGPGDSGYGFQRTIQALLTSGYGVAGVFMPRMRPGDCTGGHDALCQLKTQGSPIKFFVEPTAVVLNYLQRRARSDGFPHYRRFHMVGLSGGGWTTTLYAALDTRIERSISVAGTMPLYLRSGGSVGDREQYEPSLYERAGYMDLYILGACGRGRSQVQVLVRRDDCCFGEAQHDPGRAGATYEEAVREYEERVCLALVKLGKAAFDVIIDETAPGHTISQYTIHQVILPALRE